MPNSPPPTTNNRRRCDFCNQSPAILYCKPDNAKLCLSCDREVHSTNPLFTKHTRSLLCDGCDSSPAVILCSTDAVVNCHNCDWEKHNKPGPGQDQGQGLDQGSGLGPGLGSHDRRPSEGFSGCPSVNNLMGIFGFEDLGKKGGEEGFELGGSGFGFSDSLIVNSGVEHSYQAMGVPPLPKNRNAAFGTYKDELIRKLRELAKSETNVVDGSQDMIKPISEFLPAQNFQLEGRSSGFEQKSEENANISFEANTFQWCLDSSDAGSVDLFSDHLVGHTTEANCIVPDGKFDHIHNSSQSNVDYQGQSHHNVAENIQVFHGVGLREINSQERETAITRYKEKKKSRRYDKHIRYESRKVRAESRTRIRGRFAKMDR